MDRRLRITYAATATATLCTACLAAAAVSGSFFANAQSSLKPGVKQVETVDDYIVVKSSTTVVYANPRSELVAPEATTASTEAPTTVAETEAPTAPPTSPAPKPKRQWPRPTWPAQPGTTQPRTTEPEHQGTSPGTTSPGNDDDDHAPVGG